MWASCCAGVQYISRNGGRETTSPLSRPPARGRAPSPRRRAGRAAAAGPGRRRGTRAASSAASGTTHGETEVANDLPRNGPSGTYSQAWRSRADQSLSRTAPNTCSANVVHRDRLAQRATRRRPRTRPRPRCPAACDGPNVGAASSRRLALPARPHDVGAGDDDRAGAAVVADRQVLPVRASAARSPGGRSARRSPRGARRSRSRRSRPTSNGRCSATSSDREQVRPHRDVGRPSVSRPVSRARTSRQPRPGASSE